MSSRRVRSLLLALLTGLVLALGTAGCLEMPTPNALGVTPVTTETATARPSETPKPTRTPRVIARVLPDVLSVRDRAGGIVIDWLKAGQIVTVIECKDNWCQISTDFLTGYVFQGCLSGNKNLGCSAK